MKYPRALLLPFLLCVAALIADDKPPAPPSGSDAQAQALAALEKSAAALKYQKGTIVLADGLAKITLPENYRYLDPADTEKVLVDFWGNPRGGRSLGMIVPAGFDPLLAAGWATILSFDDDGYVQDDDAAKIDYADLLKQMQKDIAEANEARLKEGYKSIELVGWAEPPHYDPATHKLYWAKELKFGGAREHTLNYNIRMLGRRGVLVLNAVASMDELKDVQAATPALLGMVNFQEGHRYADFNEDTDKVATYGLAALVAGGIATKAGFFKALWLAILAGKKFVIIAVIALAGWGKKLWDGARQRKVVAGPGGPNPPSSA
jgi:uncharacterized membrane-anchored protein